jgi:hypothetical protein
MLVYEVSICLTFILYIGDSYFGDWYALDDVVRGVFDHEHSEVDAGGEPSELSQVS